MANKRVHDLTEQVSIADKDHEWILLDGDGLVHADDEAKKMSFAKLADEIAEELSNANDDAATLENKTIDADDNSISNIGDAEIKATAGIDASKIADGSVSNSEFQYLDGVTSGIQSQLNLKALASDVEHMQFFYKEEWTQSLGTVKNITAASLLSQIGISGYNVGFMCTAKVYYESSSNVWEEDTSAVVQFNSLAGGANPDYLEDIDLSSLTTSENYYIVVTFHLVESGV